MHTEPETRAWHSAVALQTAQVCVTEEQIGADSGQLVDTVQLPHAPLVALHTCSLAEMAQHCASSAQATQDVPEQIGVFPVHGVAH